MRIYYDTEFIEDGKTIELISIGMVAEDGRELYRVNRDAPWRRIRRNDWLMQHVVPSLPHGHGDWRNQMPKRWLVDFEDWQVVRRERIREDVRTFLTSSAHDPLELWADYAAYDHVVLAQLFGRMIDPAGRGADVQPRHPAGGGPARCARGRSTGAGRQVAQRVGRRAACGHDMAVPARPEGPETGGPSMMRAGWGEPPPGMSDEVDRAVTAGTHRSQDQLDLAVRTFERGRARTIRQAKPEWVMLGLAWDGPGVLLLASRTLTQAELDFRARSYEFASWAQFLTPGAFKPELTLQVHMHNDYVLVAGPDYITCMHALLHQWTPDDRYDEPGEPAAVEGIVIEQEKDP